MANHWQHVVRGCVPIIDGLCADLALSTASVSVASDTGSRHRDDARILLFAIGGKATARHKPQLRQPPSNTQMTSSLGHVGMGKE